MSESKLFTKNYVNDECDFAFSSGSTFGARICDRDKNSVWITSGENNDSTESSVSVTFMEGGVEVEKDIDTVMLINHNLKNPILEYWDGDSWESLDSETGLAESTTVFSFTLTTTSRIRVRNSAAQTVNAEKFIGELVACLLVVAISQDMTGYSQSFVQRKAYEIPLGDGAVHRVVVMHSLNRSAKYEAKPRFDYLTEAEIETLQATKETGDVLTWQPEATQRPDEVYQVNWTGAFSPQYVSSYKGAGYRLDLDLKEV